MSPLLLSRLGNRPRPDADRFAARVQRLSMSGERFLVDVAGEREIQPEPDLVAQPVPLPRAR